MNRDLIFGPVLVQVLLTLMLYFLLVRAKIRAMKAGEVDMARRVVLSRIVHVWIHIGSNYVPARRRVFTFGWLMVVVMALLVAWELGKRALGAGPY